MTNITDKAKLIKLVIMDVDGVLTTGELLYSDTGECHKIFNIKDGLGIKLLRQLNIKTAVISSRKSAMVTIRMRELSVDFIFQGVHNKKETYLELLDQLQLTPSEVAYIGDDLPDLACIQASGLGVSVADGHEEVKKAAHWVTFSKGGMGAVRELTDLIIASQDGTAKILEQFL